MQFEACRIRVTASVLDPMCPRGVPCCYCSDSLWAMMLGYTQSVVLTAWQQKWEHGGMA